MLMAVLTRHVQGNLNFPTNYFFKRKVNRQLAIIDIFLLKPEAYQLSWDGIRFLGSKWSCGLKVGGC